MSLTYLGTSNSKFRLNLTQRVTGSLVRSIDPEEEDGNNTRVCKGKKKKKITGKMRP